MLNNKAVAINRFLDRYMWLCVPAALAVGILLGPRISPFSFLGQYFFMLLTLTRALAMETRQFGSVMKRPKPIFIYLAAAKVVAPVFCVLAARVLLASRPEATTGYALVVVGPVAVSSLIWTAIFKGNEPLNLTIILIDTLLTPLYMPFATKLLLGASVDFEMKAMALTILKMVIIPMVVGIGANEISHNKIKSKCETCLNPVGKIALLCATILNSSTVHSQVASLGVRDLVMVPVSALILAISLLVALAAAKLFKARHEDLVSLTVGAGMKNITASLILANTFFTPEVAMSPVVHILFQQFFIALLGKFLFRDGHSAKK